MNAHYILDADHNLVTTDRLTWTLFLEDLARRRVAETFVGEIRISTVFLGIDHAFGLGPPLLFETMVFGGPHDGWLDRYSTWDEAVAGHARVVKRIQDGRDPEVTQ